MLNLICFGGDYLRCLSFLQIGGHHANEDFAVRGKEPKDEVQIYTWKDATLREITDLVGFFLSLEFVSHMGIVFFKQLFSCVTA